MDEIEDHAEGGVRPEILRAVGEMFRPWNRLWRGGGGPQP
jgi:hypothetical protein